MAFNLIRLNQTMKIQLKYSRPEYNSQMNEMKMIKML